MGSIFIEVVTKCGHIAKLKAQLKQVLELLALAEAADTANTQDGEQQVVPVLKVLQEQATKLGTASTLIAYTGYCSENNVKVCEEAKLVALIAVTRQDHHPHWRERFTEPAPLQADATPMQAMTYRLTTLKERLTPFASKRSSRCLASSNR